MKLIRVKEKVVYKSKFRGPTYVDREHGKNADITDTMLAFINKLFSGQIGIIYVK